MGTGGEWSRRGGTRGVRDCHQKALGKGHVGVLSLSGGRVDQRWMVVDLRQ